MCRKESETMKLGKKKNEVVQEKSQNTVPVETRDVNIKEIKNTTVYDANESYLCNYCAVRKSCVYWMF